MKIIIIQHGEHLVIVVTLKLISTSRGPASLFADKNNITKQDNVKMQFKLYLPDFERYTRPRVY